MNAKDREALVEALGHDWVLSDEALDRLAEHVRAAKAEALREVAAEIRSVSTLGSLSPLEAGYLEARADELTRQECRICGGVDGDHLRPCALAPTTGPDDA